eukprot:CAMPEP_0178404474 /NCGR_PEP_ID=MMETSP0689_2-20121128/17904_1 /TAXON_ID=160604 /ORGANISM="Amphidinium massartii, Strain CS-259" /LENGTH=458 /DNA_ID=CAMNT_0020025463 /DNA_START=115 /DNA_END=1491 /DNA_ORIENTATION=-
MAQHRHHFMHEELTPVPVPMADFPVRHTTGGQRAATVGSKKKSFIVQHYHSTGCAGGAFSFRAALLDPSKPLHMCTERREFRQTSMADIEFSLADKHRGGGPRVGPFQEQIPGKQWQALPKYDLTTKNRSTAFNERMHVEWENHVDHILQNSMELPTASVVAKAGFRSCSPCCRDMLALARPTGKSFIMVDLAEDDKRGTFHFVCGSEYLPVPKEALEDNETLQKLKRIVASAQAGNYSSSSDIADAVKELNAPIDRAAQALYTTDSALMPASIATDLKGDLLLQVLHAEHFARLCGEYGASILRDPARASAEKEAVHACRAVAKQQLIEAWRQVLPPTAGIDLLAYAAAATQPLFSESPIEYSRMRQAALLPCRKNLNPEQQQDVQSKSEARRWRAPNSKSKLTAEAKLHGGSDAAKAGKADHIEDDNASTVGASTAVPDDGATVWEDSDEEEVLEE